MGVGGERQQEFARGSENSARGNDLFGGKRKLEGPDCEGLIVIILHAVFYLIIDLIYQVSVFIEQNTETVVLK